MSIDNFDMVKRIGKGAFGDVFMATMIHGDGQSYAIKILDKAHIAQTNTLENVLDEKKILKMCHEPEETPFIVQVSIKQIHSLLLSCRCAGMCVRSCRSYSLASPFDSICFCSVNAFTSPSLTLHQNVCSYQY